MRLAICDDNAADRKQLERLLKRESDRRSSGTGILYADSYGNADALLNNPMQYDAFYIDLCHTPDATGQSVVEALVSRGVHVPIILCCSDLDYRKIRITGADNGQILYLDKPIRTSELSDSIDHALAVRATAPTMIELREAKETFYVTEPEILYGIEEGRCVMVHLTDGRIIQAADTAANLFSAIETHPSFFSPTPKTIVNARHIRKLGFRKVIMSDGSVFKIHRECMDYAKYAFAEFGGKPTDEA